MHTTLLFVSLLFAQSLFGQKRINPTLPATSPQKAGYNLIFEDNFDTFQADVWDKSKPGDDGEGYEQTALICENLNARQAPKNEINVLTPQNGLLPLRIKRGEERNACGYSSAEIKTFSNDENKIQRAWKVYPNALVEVRMKVPFGKGLGGSAWLYGPSTGNYSEIDLIETYGKRTTSYQTNFFTGPSEDMDSKSKRIKLVDFSGKKVVISDHFLTYAAEIVGDQSIKYFVNDVLVDTKNQKTEGKYKNLRFAQSYNIRVSTGSTSLSGGDIRLCDSLPVYMYVDFVRVYQKAGTNAVKLTTMGDNPESNFNSQSGGNQGILANHYPKATYFWTASPQNPSYKVTIENEDADHQYGDDARFFWVTVPQNSPIGTYIFTLNVTFPSGYVEKLEKKLVVK
jgi:beta-glucanase (GH16 family)